MKLDEIKEFLRTKPGYLKSGSGKLALLLEADVKKVKRAIKEVKKELAFPKEKDIEENLLLRKRWFNGKTWCESFENVNTDPHPLDRDDWVEIIKEIGPIDTLTSIEEELDVSKTLMVWSSDKHIGASIPSDALYKREYNRHIFHARMVKIFDKIVEYVNLHGKFEEIVLADLGDSLDGFNKRTTRGGHELPQNLSNKEAAKVHFYSHKWLYDSVIKSDLAGKVTVLNITNDNHAGDFGWHACFGLENYAELAWPNMNFINQEEFIGHYEVYERAFLVTHGKDKKNRFKGLPLAVNADVESFMMDYAIDRKISHKYLHVRKGDLHMNKLDCSRLRMSYFNVGSVFGSSDWIMDNFSDGEPSCVFEVVEKGNNDIDAKIVWL